MKKKIRETVKINHTDTYPSYLELESSFDALILLTTSNLLLLLFLFGAFYPLFSISASI